MIPGSQTAAETPARSLQELKAGTRPEIENLRRAISHMSGAERRLRARDHARPGQLTVVQLRALAALARDGEMTAGQLARSVDLNPATVTGVLDQLETTGLVRRHRSTADRRVLNVSLTSPGWELLEGKLAAWQSLWEAQLTGVTDEQIQIAVRVIEQVTQLYGEICERIENMEPRQTRRD